MTANCLHPGVIGTQLLSDYMGVPIAGRALARTFGASAEKGAETSIYLASSPDMETVSGKYFEAKRERHSSRKSYDEAAARRLWGGKRAANGAVFLLTPNRREAKLLPCPSMTFAVPAVT